ncbi:MAG: hypothetical protein ACI8S6_004200 [Myxococcota bacterium]|jgi:hypothetical protein
MTGILLSSLIAAAGPLPDAEEFIATYHTEPPNILFLLDLSGGLDASCGDEPCIDSITETLGDLATHTDWANLGVVGTSTTGLRDYTQLVAVGADRDALRAAVDSLGVGIRGDRNLAETLSLVSKGYLMLPASGTYSSGAFDDGPICASCQDTHIVVLTAGLPDEDDDPVAPLPDSSSMSWNIRCGQDGLLSESGSDSRCLYDNLTWLLYNRDHTGMSGQQKVTTHTLYVSPEADGVPHTLFISAAYQTGYQGSYRIALDSSGLRRALADIMEWIRWPLVGDSAPLIHAAGDRVLYSYYQSKSADPLHRGHLLAYEIGIDEATPSTLGQVVYDGESELGGALWDAGVLLSERPVVSSELNEGDRDGEGARDLYTFLPELAAQLSATQQVTDGRFDFDRSLIELLQAHPAVAPVLLPVGAVGDDEPWDLDHSGRVDIHDLQVLVDFTRGVSSTPYRHLSRYRGTWRLGDAPRATPAIIRGRDNNYSNDPTYRRFLQAVSQQPVEVALLATNAGMLHAFDLATGEELWGWVPGRLLLAERDSATEGRLIDVLRFGRQRLLEGSVAVEDVWIDHDNDGLKSCDGLLSSCEWRRVALVSAGRGGPGVLALDVTDPTSPRFLWEQTDPDHPDATGYGAQSVIVAPLQDGDQLRWTALWGSGTPRQPVEGASSALSEPTLYLRALDDTYDASPRSTFAAQAATGRFPTGGLVWPDASGADLDRDGRPEQGAIAGSPAAVDLDNDGDVDVMYLHVTETSSGTARSTLHKLSFGDDPDSPTWCALFDDSAAAGQDVSVAFSPTTSWMTDGSLAIFWGSGGPMTGRTDAGGMLFGIRDPAPWGCVTPTPLCGEAGVLPLSAGARLTDSPLIYNGTVYFTSWSTTAKGCGSGSGRIYGLSYSTCAGTLTDPVTGEVGQEHVSVASYPSTITFSDHGRLLYAASGSEPIMSLETADPQQGTSLISHMVLR